MPFPVERVQQAFLQIAGSGAEPQAVGSERGIGYLPEGGLPENDRSLVAEHVDGNSVLPQPTVYLGRNGYIHLVTACTSQLLLFITVHR